MYKPNFVLVDGVGKIIDQTVKEFIAEKQIKGDYSDIEDILMNQFKSMSEGVNNEE